MIPFDFFYKAFYDNFLKKLSLKCFHINLIETDIGNSISIMSDDLKIKNSNCIIFYDQEPIDLYHSEIDISSLSRVIDVSLVRNRILVTSEYSTEQEVLSSKLRSKHVHYFYHALICHEWYREYWFRNIQINNKFDRLYITYNNLILDKRLYRANLIVELHKNSLLEHGYVSYNNSDSSGIEKSANSYVLLPSAHKTNILSHLDLLTQQLSIDTKHQHGSLSAEINIESMQKAFVNLVTETVFYENKVHLTEKTFKPIIAKMPFILMAGAGNLAYLRKYGFKTFGDFWDEGYDSISNNVDRFNAVIDILKYLSELPHSRLVEMREEMRDILEYNYNHFFITMKPIVVKEFIENLGTALGESQVEFDPVDLESLHQLLLY